MSLSLVITTVSRKKAARLAKAVVEKRLAACGNIAVVKSIYRWKGSLHSEGEALIVFKTSKERAHELRHFLERKHPYDVPEIVQVEPGHVNQKYLLWVLESVAR